MNRSRPPWLAALLLKLAGAVWIVFRSGRLAPPPAPAPPVVPDDAGLPLTADRATDALGAIEAKKAEVDWRTLRWEDQRAAERESYAG